MSANVETMFSVREKPWHRLGTIVQDAPTSADALHLAGLDWKVIQEPLVTMSGAQTSVVGNFRDTDKSFLGVVTPKYRLCQNNDAFSFTDNLIGGEVRYETAGSLSGGKRVWMLAKMPSVSILGDEVEPYLCFTNSHDGEGSIKVCMTPIRVVCNNTLNLALSGAQKKWSCRHMGTLESKLAEARETLGLAELYMNRLNEFANQAVDIKVDDATIEKMLATIYPIKDNATDCLKRKAEEKRQEFYTAYAMPDIAQFMGTAWGVIQAATDVTTHRKSQRAIEGYEANRWDKIIDGRTFTDEVMDYLKIS